MNLLPCILLIENEAPLRRFLSTFLADVGYAVAASDSAGVADAGGAGTHADLVLLGCPGWGPAEEAALGQVRQRLDAPVLVMAPCRSELDRRKILRAGADDLAAKPVSPAELLARIQSLLYRANYFGSADAVFVTGDLVIDAIQRTVSIAGAEVALTEAEYLLLRALAMHPGQSLAPARLCRLAFGNGYRQMLDSLPRLIQGLRQKLVEHGRPQWIQADRGPGYRFQQGAGQQTEFEGSNNR